MYIPHLWLSSIQNFVHTTIILISIIVFTFPPLLPKFATTELAKHMYSREELH